MPSVDPRLLLLAACLLLTLGCPDPAPQHETPTPDAAPSPQPSPPPPDASLPLESYLEAGVPAPDRSWSGADTARAASALTKLAQANPRQLPRYESPRSGALFSRLVAADNLDLYRNTSLAIEQRLGQGIECLQATNELLKTYAASFNGGGVGGAELIELMGMQLRVLSVMFDMVDEFLPTLDREAADYSVRMRGLARMKNGFAQMVSGCLMTLTEREVYSAAELKRFARYLREILPGLSSKLSAAGRQETLVRLRGIIAEEREASLKTELERLLQELEAQAGR